MNPVERLELLLDDAQSKGELIFVRDRDALKRSTQVTARGRRIEVRVRHRLATSIGFTLYVRLAADRERIKFQLMRVVYAR